MAIGVPVARPRRTQAERRATTRRKLLDATIDCLVELGYARTTTTEVARRAGVSRGAQLHHFPTKSELVLSAIEHLTARRAEEFRRAFVRLPRGVDRAAAAVDLLWSIQSQPSFYAALELLVAARTDPDLRARIAEMNRRQAASVEATFRALFPAGAGRNRLYAAAPPLALALMDGLMLWRIAWDDPPFLRAVMDGLKAFSREALRDADQSAKKASSGGARRRPNRPKGRH
jgi:AcrR family transcriptional regulator